MTAKRLADRIHRMLVADLSLGNRTAATDHAVVVTNPEFPLVPEANLVHSVRLPRGISVQGLVEEVEPRLAASGTPWRHVVVDPGATPEGLGKQLEATGFRPHVRVGAAYLAAPTAEPNRKVEIRGIAEKSAWGQFSSLRRQIQADGGRSGEELEQYAALVRRRSLSSNIRFYLALQEFEPVGHVGLLSVGRTGLVVDLAVRTDRRGQGIGRAMLRKMVEQSRSLGHDLTCLLYDESERLESLVSRMGFEPGARFVSYLRRAKARKD